MLLIILLLGGDVVQRLSCHLISEICMGGSNSHFACTVTHEACFLMAQTITVRLSSNRTKRATMLAHPLLLSWLWLLWLSWCCCWCWWCWCGRDVTHASNHGGRTPGSQTPAVPATWASTSRWTKAEKCCISEAKKPSQLHTQPISPQTGVLRRKRPLDPTSTFT